MANPQPDQYTRISNEVLEAIMKFKFNGTQLRIVMAVWRYTYGFNRKSAELSLSFLSKVTDIPVRLLRKEIERLTETHVLIVAKGCAGNKGREIGFNKDYDKWINQNASPTEPKKQLKQEDDYCDSEGTNQARGPIRPEDQLVHTGEDQLVHTGEDQLVPQEIKLKENYKENIYIVVFDHWSEQGIVVHRELTDKMKNEIKKAVKESGKEQVLKAITRFGAMYHDPSCEWCKYAWGLDTFLKRAKGYKSFLDDGEKWINYQRQKDKTQQARAPDKKHVPVIGGDAELM